jgi:hypothetical protein
MEGGKLALNNECVKPFGINAEDYISVIKAPKKKKGKFKQEQ